MTVSVFAGNDLVLFDGIEVDARVGEFHSFSATVSRFALESGAPSADHIVASPDRLDVVFSMTNLDPEGVYGTRAATVLDNLRQRLKGRQLYEVATRHRLYPSMAVTAITAENSGPFGGALEGVRVTFEEVNRVTLERIRTAEPARETATKQTNAGRVQPKEPTPAQADKASEATAKATGKPKSVVSQLFKG
jgi:hypothetical protein